MRNVDLDECRVPPGRFVEAGSAPIFPVCVME
jgi:hypothetical protein